MVARWCSLVLPLLLSSACTPRSGVPNASTSSSTAPVTSPAAAASAGTKPQVDPVAQISEVRAGADLTPQAWPNGAPFALLLIFDFDAEYAPYGVGRQPKSGGELAPQTSAGEFDARRGLPRVLDLLVELGVKATFAIPGAVAELHPDSVRAILAGGHEVAFHGWRHEDLEALGSRAEEEALLDRSRAALEKLGAKPNGFRAPYGRLSPFTLRLLDERAMAWDSSLYADDLHPYRLRIGGTETRVVELPVAPYLNDWALFGSPGQLGPQTDPDAVERIWLRELAGAEKERGLLTFTLHPQVIGRHHRLGLLRKLLTEAKKRRAWIARAAEVVAHVGGSRR